MNRLGGMGIVAFLAFVPIASGQTIRYVDQDAPLNGNGQSWATAFKYLQDALAAVTPDSEIRVAQGTYRPDRDAAHPGGTGDRTATFQLRNQVILFGGFAGLGAPDPNARDVSAYLTILSGDLAGDDGPNFANTGENSYHVVTGNGTDSSTELNGFTVTSGNANGSADPNDKGGGILNLAGGAQIRDCIIASCQANWNGAGAVNTREGFGRYYTCTFRDNSAQLWGGAMTTESGSIAVIEDCVFQNNTANGDNGALDNYDALVLLARCTFTGNHANGTAGAVQLNGGTQASVIDCVFRSNSSGYGAGAMAYVNGSTGRVSGCTFEQNTSRFGGALAIWSGSSLEIENCQFRGNTASGNGGAADMNASSPVVRDCLFAGNSVATGGGSGGAMIIVNNANASVVGCTVASNSAPLAGGITVDASTVSVSDCLLWGNTAGSGTLESQQLRKSSGILNASYCDVQGWTGGLGGTGNVGLDPGFVDLDGPDNDLATWQDNDYHVAAGSPCTDAGDPNAVLHFAEVDLDGYVRVHDGNADNVCRVDIGAYEFGAGDAEDCNHNGISDTCEIASNPSRDCQSDDILDECQLGSASDYVLDDGSAEMSCGPLGGHIAWMNHFQVVAGAETISTIEIAYGRVANGTPLAVYLWSDPNQDGDPTDGVVVASAPAVVANAWTSILNTVHLSPTFIGPAGTHFFVGAVMHSPAEFPMQSDTTSHHDGHSWAATDSVPIDPNNLGGATYPVARLEGRNLLIRAGHSANDCNNNGILDVCDITSQESPDLNDDGIPDECTCELMGDLDGVGGVNGSDVQCFVACAIGGDTSGCNCPCGDFAPPAGIDAQDARGFVAELLRP